MAAGQLAVSGGGGAGAAGNRPSLARAYLQMHEPMPASGGGAKLGAATGRIDFQFNPTELTVAKRATWSSRTVRQAESAGTPEFQGAEPCQLSLEMFLDATASMDDSVVRTVDRLFECCVPTDRSLGNRKPVPPLVVLHWGSVTGFAAYITSVSARYSLFTPQGTPVRATCTVELAEMPVDTPRQNPTSGGLDARRVHTLTEGETLAAVAYREYGDPALWRGLAEVNGIDDPLRLTPGSVLVVPVPEELAQVGARRPDADRPAG